MLFQFLTYLRLTIIEIKNDNFIDISEWKYKYLTISIRICFSGTIYFPLRSLRETHTLLYYLCSLKALMAVSENYMLHKNLLIE